jgi:hypothetical protein
MRAKPAHDEEPAETTDGVMSHESKPDEPKAEAKPERFRVLKAFTLGDGRTVMPGEEFAPEGADWPPRRSKQLVEQKYLRPIE